MAMKRILNKTAKTLIIPYGGGTTYIRLKRASVTTPLSENHPIFMDPALGGMEQRGLIQVLSDADYKEQFTRLKQELIAKQTGTKSASQAMVDTEKERKRIEEHNRMVDARRRAAKLEKDNVRGDATAVTLVEEIIPDKIAIPKATEQEKRVVDLENATFSSQVSDATDGDFESLKTASIAFMKSEEAKKFKPKLSKKAKKAAAAAANAAAGAASEAVDESEEEESETETDSD